MRAGVYRGIRDIRVQDVSEPGLGPLDAIVAVKACGICGSDMHTYLAGGPPVEVGQVMGHEFAGEVVAVGDEVEGVGVGDRVAGFPVLACGTCRRCRAGKRHLCDNWVRASIGFGLPGAFAERVRIPNAQMGRNVHRLPDTVSFDVGALAEPTAVAVHAVDQAALTSERTTVVFGLGTVGLQVAQVLLARGMPAIVGVDRSRFRQEIAEQLGVAMIEGDGDLPTRVRSALGGQEADVVFETSGSAALIQTAIETVAPGGTVVVVSLYGQPAELNATLVTVKELTIRGSSTYTPEQFAEAVDLLATGRVANEPLVTQRYPLGDLAHAFENQLDKETTVKVMITIDG